MVNFNETDDEIELEYIPRHYLDYPAGKIPCNALFKLRNKYNFTLKEIGDVFGVSKPTAARRKDDCKKLKERGLEELTLTDMVLRNVLISLRSAGISLHKISDYTGLNRNAVKRLFKEYKIPIKRITDIVKKREAIDCEMLRKLYEKYKLNIGEIADIIDVNRDTVRTRMKECEIKVRSAEERGKLWPKKKKIF